MFDSYHVALFTLQTRDFGKIQDGPQCVKWCMATKTKSKIRRQQLEIWTIVFEIFQYLNQIVVLIIILSQ